MRILPIVCLLGALGPALAQTGPKSVPPPYSVNDQWPTVKDRWSYNVQAPSASGRTKFTYIEATPDGRMGWNVTVACGEHATKTGKEFSRIVAEGSAGRGRMPAIGGQATFPGGEGFSFLINQPVDSESLDLKSLVATVRCASGFGQLSTGD